VIHPQSIVHSMVEFTDGSTMAQCSPPDMRLPIALGLGWPERVPQAAPGMDWSSASTWEFSPLDDTAFPAVRLARRCGAAGSTYPAAYNAANEVCVEGFLAGRIRFTHIVDTVARVIDDLEAPAGALAVDDVLSADRWARERAHQLLPGGPTGFGVLSSQPVLGGPH
jgi:1-deoxy-D-xylulose-5-phosphate reductoisomerase